MKRGLWVGFAALCLLAGSGWIVGEWQQAVPGFLPVALRSGVLAVVFGAVQWGRRRANERGLSSGALMAPLGWSVLMVALPTVVAIGAEAHVSPLTETLVFSLVPVFVVFFVSQRAAGFGAGESPLRLLVPALAGFAGAALLLPFHVPVSGAGQSWLALLLATAAVSAWAAIQLHRQMAGVPVLVAGAIFSAATFLISTPLCLLEAGRSSSWKVDWSSSWRSDWSASTVEIEVLRGLLLEGPAVLLTVWLLREVSPVAFSSRYMLVIAVTVAEGWLLLRPEAGWTTGLGMLLLIGSGVWLLLADSANSRAVSFSLGEDDRRG